ncbi:NHL repeat-containing protein [Pararhodonellum marinum]|uniref:ATP-binding protein n=1 Tax=Pararhodonellum marinum TaxID=2755358 RepID=UPI00188EE2B3|nr:ATP-binding protein [Pararhodonellum marinum]
MKNPLSLFSLIACYAMLFWQCGAKDSAEAVRVVPVEPSLEMVWETPAELNTCESVLYDPQSGRIYVSNINGDPSVKDGNGFISIINLEGKIVTKEWVKGLNAPKGMGIVGKLLYVTDIDELVEIDTETARITNRYRVNGAQFLNDVDTHEGRVYFSDMRAGNIHLLQNGSVSLFAEGQENINGLRVRDDGTVYGLDGSGLKKYSSDGNFEVVNAIVTGGDGLIILDDDAFLASRWQGEIWLIEGEKETKLLDTKDQESNTADIEFIPSQDLVLVPTFFKNKVVAYKLDY